MIGTTRSTRRTLLLMVTVSALFVTGLAGPARATHESESEVDVTLTLLHNKRR